LLEGFFLCTPLMTERLTWPVSLSELTEQNPIIYMDELAANKFVIRVTKSMQLVTDILDMENARFFVINYLEAIKGGLMNQEAIVRAQQQIKTEKPT
jgi:hypothetical protein